MLRKFNAFWSLAALALVALAVDCNASDLVISREMLRRMDPHLLSTSIRKDYALEIAAKKPNRNRAMLAFPAQRSFCFAGDNGECIPDTLSNLEDQGLVEYFTKVLKCLRNTAVGTCNADADCLWQDGECRLETILATAQCFDTGRVAISRGGGCEDLPSAAHCDSLPGCTWTGVCETDIDEVREAVSPALEDAIRKDIDCGNLAVCSGECQQTNSGCRFPGIGILNWVTSSTPFCEFIVQSFSCADQIVCTGACSARPAGGCFLDIAGQGFVDIAYASNPTLRGQMTTAVDTCPTIVLPSACAAFQP